MSDRFRLMLLILAVATAALAPTASADTLAEARERFAAGEYESAVPLFEQAAKSMPPSAAIYFELGKAQSAAGSEARAALSFERALVLDPGFAAARSALAQSAQALGFTVPNAGWVSRLQGVVAPGVLTVSGTLAFWFAAIILLVSIFARNRRGLFPGALGLFTLAALLLAGAWFLDPRITRRDEAVVLADGGVNLLKSPVENSEQAGRIPAGGTVQILSQRGRWFYGRIPTGATGWFPSQDVVPLIPPP